MRRLLSTVGISVIVALASWIVAPAAITHASNLTPAENALAAIDTTLDDYLVDDIDTAELSDADYFAYAAKDARATQEALGLARADLIDAAYLTSTIEEKDSLEDIGRVVLRMERHLGNIEEAALAQDMKTVDRTIEGFNTAMSDYYTTSDDYRYWYVTGEVDTAFVAAMLGYMSAAWILVGLTTGAFAWAFMRMSIDSKKLRTLRFVIAIGCLLSFMSLGAFAFAHLILTELPAWPVWIICTLPLLATLILRIMYHPLARRTK